MQNKNTKAKRTPADLGLTALKKELGIKENRSPADLGIDAVQK